MKNPSSAPPESELRTLYEQHDQNIAAIARHLKRPTGTVKHWYYAIGLMPGYRTKKPANLKALHEKHRGHMQSIADDIGVWVGSVKDWCRREGLEAQPKYKYSYPRRLDVEIKNGLVVVFSDAHWWEREKSPAHKALLSVIKSEGPSVVIANGDMLDGARVSRHDPLLEQETPSLVDEIQVVTENMAEIRRAANGAETFFTWGNHDTRPGRLLLRDAPEFEKIEGTRLSNIILGWQFCWSVMMNDGTGEIPLFITHRIRGGQHATWNNILKAGTHTATGHLHAQMVYQFTDLRGTRYGVDLGCLADPQGPQFAYTEASPLNWRSGFAAFEFKNYRMLPPRLVTVTDWGEVYMQSNRKLA